MDSSLVTVLTTTVGVTGTLAGSALTQIFARRGERDRRSAEDQSRWLTERLRVTSDLINRALSLERILWSACAHLDRDDREERLPGYTSIELIPEEGIEGVIDSVTREILIDAVGPGLEAINKLDSLAAELALISTPAEAVAAEQLIDALLNTIGLLEAFYPFDAAADSVLACRNLREELILASRKSLRVDPDSAQFAPPRRLKLLDKKVEKEHHRPHQPD